MTETFTYGLFNRPAMYGTVPASFTNEQSHKDFAYGTIDYSHRLTDEEIYRYELARVSPNTFDLPIGATVERLDAGEDGYTIIRYYRGRYILTHKSTGDEEYSVKVSDVRAVAAPAAKVPATTAQEAASDDSTDNECEQCGDTVYYELHNGMCHECAEKYGTSEAVADAGDKPARQYQSGDIVKTYQHTITGVVGDNGSPDGINVEVKWSYATEVVKSVDLILVTPIEEQDTWQGAYVRLRAENEALRARLDGYKAEVVALRRTLDRSDDTTAQLRAQLAAARANLAVAQKALIAITSVKYDDMQAVRDRAETGLIESDYYVASLK